MQGILSKEGFQFAHATPPDVITLDVLMLGMDGWAVLRALTTAVSDRRMVEPRGVEPLTFSLRTRGSTQVKWSEKGHVSRCLQRISDHFP